MQELKCNLDKYERLRDAFKKIKVHKFNGVTTDTRMLCLQKSHLHALQLHTVLDIL